MYYIISQNIPKKKASHNIFNKFFLVITYFLWRRHIKCTIEKTKSHESPYSLKNYFSTLASEKEEEWRKRNDLDQERGKSIISRRFSRLFHLLPPSLLHHQQFHSFSLSIAKNLVTIVLLYNKHAIRMENSFYIKNECFIISSWTWHLYLSISLSYLKSVILPVLIHNKEGEIKYSNLSYRGRGKNCYNYKGVIQMSMIKNHMAWKHRTKTP